MCTTKLQVAMDVHNADITAAIFNQSFEDKYLYILAEQIATRLIKDKLITHELIQLPSHPVHSALREITRIVTSLEVVIPI